MFIAFNYMYTQILCFEYCHGNRCSSVSNFPAKRQAVIENLEKIRAFKIRMRRFFFQMSISIPSS